jgi:ADP-ribosylglycohydrolase
MFGAFLGDIIGSPYEFDMGNKSKDFPLFSDVSTFTDDSVMTAAVADALLDSIENGKLSDDSIGVLVAFSLKEWGHKYPDAGYGGMFDNWLMSDSILPYNSFGNGSAMRVSSVGWLYDTIERTRAVARITAKVTHNHPEGIKGAEAVASAIFLARKRASKQEIKKYISENFGYNLSRTCDEIRPGYHHVETCQETVPEAIIAFLESDGFVDAM